MQPEAREHYCSYCLRLLERDDEHCSRPSCGRPRPTSGWSFFFEGGENIDGQFRIRNRLGVGGAGVTYRAIDLAADDPEHRDVAIKILHKDRFQGILRDRLRLEGEVLRRFHHPNIVSFRGLKVEGGEPYYLATGFVAGGSLDEFLRDVRRLSARTVLQIGAQIARALASAHAIGVTHRDLKPSNILVRDRAEYPLQIRVADWGIARAVPEFIPRKHVTIQGGFVGTPEFASPEQLRGESNVGPPTDIFGLGVLMHSLAGGQPVRDLVARGAVDYRSLREGASRYERIPLTSEGSSESHLPLLDELVDQLITRTPEARPNAETVAAYCEELIEAGDTTPKSGKQMSPMPALVPAAAFETPKEELFLPPEGDKAPPLQLSGETQERKGPTTVEMCEPPTPSEELERGDTLAMESESRARAAAAATLAAPVATAAVVDETPDYEKPWPGEDEELGSTPTAVPEEMESLPAMDVLKPSSAPTAPVLLNEPKPSLPGDPSLLRDIAPILERDDEPARQRTWWPLMTVMVVLGIVVAVIASPAVRETWASRLDSLFTAEMDPLAGKDPSADHSMGLGILPDGGIRLTAAGRRLGLPTPPRNEKRRTPQSLLEVDEVDTPEASSPKSSGKAPGQSHPRSTGSLSPKHAGMTEQAGGLEAGGVSVKEGAEAETSGAASGASAPQEGFVIDHGTAESDSEESPDSGPRSKSRPIWSRRPGAPRVGGAGYKTSRKKEADASRQPPPTTDPPPPPEEEEDENEPEQAGPGAKFRKSE